MILGIDTGMASFGWSLLDEATCRFEDLGVVTTDKGVDVNVSLERARRMTPQARLLAELAPLASTIIVERMSFPPGGVKAAAPILLSWGVIIGVVAMLNPRPRLLTIAPQRWQREVLPAAGKEIDYDELARQAATYVLANHPKAARALKGIADKHRNHAIDAAMIALCGALRPHRCEVVVEMGLQDEQRRKTA